jgi:hypothetical protein
MRKGAILDQTGNYRYSLWRIWDEKKPRVMFILLNPGTADETYDDLTITRCLNFARRWGFGSLEVVNLFAYRATDYDELLEVTDPVGEKNDQYILEAAERADKIVLAWGTRGSYKNRDMEVLQLLTEYNLYAIDLSKRGHPRHPLQINTHLDLMKLV